MINFPECEWNPKENRTAYDDEFHATATIIAGVKDNIFLCRNCANLPKFKRLKKIAISGRKLHSPPPSSQNPPE